MVQFDTHMHLGAPEATEHKVGTRYMSNSRRDFSRDVMASAITSRENHRWEGFMKFEGAHSLYGREREEHQMDHMKAKKVMNSSQLKANAMPYKCCTHRSGIEISQSIEGFEEGSDSCSESPEKSMKRELPREHNQNISSTNRILLFAGRKRARDRGEPLSNQLYVEESSMVSDLEMQRSTARKGVSHFYPSEATRWIQASSVYSGPKNYDIDCALSRKKVPACSVVRQQSEQDEAPSYLLKRSSVGAMAIMGATLRRLDNMLG
ncbi:hypothetical protein KP509_12G017900 [Ceratopteris richardii]|nr:hypothetical protein KP509_12G017900 [Ceratopteris richardii]